MDKTMIYKTLLIKLNITEKRKLKIEQQEITLQITMVMPGTPEWFLFVILTIYRHHNKEHLGNK